MGFKDTLGGGRPDATSYQDGNERDRNMGGSCGHRPGRCQRRNGRHVAYKGEQRTGNCSTTRPQTLNDGGEHNL